MPRLIDAKIAEEIIWKRSEEMRDSEPKLSGALAAAIGFLDKCPTVDAVPIVRCGKCKYLYIKDLCTGACSHNMCGVVSPNDFCSYGVRKDDAE